MNPSPPAISVVICTYNRAHLLGRTLEALCDESVGFSVDVIVVDNNSADDTKDVVTACQRSLSGPISLRYLFEPVQGLSVARNTGVGEACGSIVAFLDDEAVPSRNWLSETKALFDEKPEVSAAGGPIDPEFEIPRPEWLSVALEPYYTILDLGEASISFPRKCYPFGASMAFRRDILEKDPFPTHLGRRGTLLLSMEETELFKRVLVAGGQIYYHPGMRVRHFVPKERLTKDWIFERLYFQGVSKAFSQTSLARKGIFLGQSVLQWIAGNVMRCLRLRGDAFLDECYLKRVQGAFDGLLGKVS